MLFWQTLFYVAPPTHTHLVVTSFMKLPLSLPVSWFLIVVYLPISVFVCLLPFLFYIHTMLLHSHHFPQSSLKFAQCYICWKTNNFVYLTLWFFPLYLRYWYYLIKLKLAVNNMHEFDSPVSKMCVYIYALLPSYGDCWFLVNEAQPLGRVTCHRIYFEQFILHIKWLSVQI